MVESNGEKGKSEGDHHHHQQHHGGGGGESGGRALKKGPWTAAEDGILIEYVKKHGEGNWNAVQKHTGLARCGKSCRLRWANHLRPNLKKGSFSQEEERIIIELHAKLGNKWARMAAQLPGRTDNEIKNYWNTRMKRRQRAGLPLYPLEIQQEATAFHLRQHHHHHHHHHHQQQHPSSAAANNTYSALRQKPDFNNNNPNSVSIFNFSSAINNTQKNFSDGSSFYATPTSQFKFFPDNNNGGGFALPLSPVSPFPQIGQQMNQSLSPPPQAALQLNYGSYVCNSNSGLNSMIFGAPYHHLIPGLETELPSIQTPPHSTTPASSGTSGGDGIMAAANSGLLDVVLLEAEARSRNGKQSKEESSSGGELKRTVEQGSTEEEDANLYVESVLGSSGGEAAAAAGENQSDEFSSSHSSSRKRPRMEPLEEMDSMDDDDLMSLLNNFQSGMPVPEWYPGNGDDDLGITTHNGPSLCESNSNPEGDEQRPNEASPSAVGSPVLEWSLGSSCWNNMPSIC